VSSRVENPIDRQNRQKAATLNVKRNLAIYSTLVNQKAPRELACKGGKDII
jgi:hypothetical protein